MVVPALFPHRPVAVHLPRSHTGFWRSFRWPAGTTSWRSCCAGSPGCCAPDYAPNSSQLPEMVGWYSHAVELTPAGGAWCWWVATLYIRRSRLPPQRHLLEHDLVSVDAAGESEGSGGVQLRGHTTGANEGVEVVRPGDRRLAPHQVGTGHSGERLVPRRVRAGVWARFAHTSPATARVAERGCPGHEQCGSGSCDLHVQHPSVRSRE